MVKITNILQKPRINIDSSISSKNVQKKYGKPEDNTELFITDINGNIIYSEENFTEYLPETDLEGLFSEFNMDPVTLLRNKGFTVGIILIKISKLKKYLQVEGKLKLLVKIYLMKD